MVKIVKIKKKPHSSRKVKFVYDHFVINPRRHVFTCKILALLRENWSGKKQELVVLGRGAAILNPVDLEETEDKKAYKINVYKGFEMARGRAITDMYFSTD